MCIATATFARFAQYFTDIELRRQSMQLCYPDVYVTQTPALTRKKLLVCSLSDAHKPIYLFIYFIYLPRVSPNS